ncbi:MAG: hypothetical protein PHE29_11920 [Tissierellia bacterium]|nr:hypothetical protein [Tissierellia bacterium]MDD4407002.1 hypothetical protein [Bacilli bacterium]
MKKGKLGHKNRVKNLVIALSLTAIILSVSTYAWFVGMRTVSVTNFDVTIAGTEDLQLSLNGATWKDTVAINAENFDDDTSTVYEGNTNWWSGGGLIPMSSVGDIDSTVSRMILFEKASLTPSLGGYRLIASRAENDVDYDVPGYVAFDLFIKNSSGTQYIEEYQPLDEEAIYLSTDSQVTVSASGVANTGIENSVRVAFAQIGRVKGTTDTAATITGITCADVAGSVTGICTKRAQIWEPNDKAHVVGAISWYQTSCKQRTEAGAFIGEFGGCGPFVNGTTYPTYAVAKEITSGDAVDVYDGASYNGYVHGTEEVGYKPYVASTTAPAEGTALLESYTYFTDSMKILTGTARPQFMTLAPNSITKVRVYIYIEGQDIDNYDFASIGKSISVQFGFTKQRYIESDIPGYTAPITTSTTTTETTTTTAP